MNVLETALGALLHDIGKFSQRAFRPDEGLSPQSRNMMQMICPTAQHGGSTHLHVLHTNEFMEKMPFLPDGLDRARVANLASYHHRPDTPLQQLVAKADRLSSGMERQASEDEATGGRAAFRRTRLLSVASTLSPPDVPLPCRAALPLTPLSPQEAFPQPNADREDLTNDYRQLWETFVPAWAKNRCDDPLRFINRATSVLERFTWCIPSATNVVPDISLFDHLKTTAAIAACLHLAGESAENPFLLVAADLTGIQKYIFDIRPGSGGLARRLRARSFQVAAYLEAVSLCLLEHLRLPVAQRILFAGDKFHLLLPNTPEARAELDTTKTAVSRWLFDISGGEIGLALAAGPLDEDGLRNFSASLADLNNRLRETRDRAGESVLIEADAWSQDRFVLPELSFSGAEGLCECCGRRAGQMPKPYETEMLICHQCLEERDLGRLLPRRRYVAFFAEAESDAIPAPLGSFRVLRGDEPAAARQLLVLDLDGVGDGPSEQPVFGAFRARYVPSDPATGTPVEFSELAGRSQGRPALGYLKLDVDNLGYLFAQGFRTAEPPQPAAEGAPAGRDRTSISRVAALSRTLEIFFSGYLETLLRTSFPNVYLIYSGGDDIAAVGPWDQIFDLALGVRQQFRRFTAGNAAFTLSAGLAVVHYHLPVLAAIEQADELLDASKTAPGDGVLPWPLPAASAEAPQKDRITAFDTSFPWAEYEATLVQARQVLEWLQDGTLNTSKLRRLLIYADMERQFTLTRDTRYLQYVPYLVRDLRRNWAEKTPAQQQARHWAARLVEPQSQEMKTVRFICQYALYGNRQQATGE